MARELSPDMTPGVNRPRSLFTGPAARARHPDWEQYTAAIVAHLRAQAGSQTEDARLHALIGELSLKSERFRQLWSRHDVRAGHSGAFSVASARQAAYRLSAEVSDCPRLKPRGPVSSHCRFEVQGTGPAPRWRPG